MWSYFRFRFKRASRRLRRNAHVWRIWLGNYLDRHVYGAWRKLGAMRWLFLAWIAIVTLSFWGGIYNINSLGGHYLTTVAARGGTYREGLVGDVRGVNPILPEGAAASDVARLVFSGLTRVGPERQITPDLAQKWEISADAKTYTFYINPKARWHDGRQLTAEDVVFTISLIQNPDTRSALSANWQGVRSEIINPQVVRFILPKTFTPFLSSTTVGILPKHILASVKPANLRIDEFNFRPIGSGPFKLKHLQTNTGYIELSANSNYHLGRPLLDKIRLVNYEKPEDMADGFAKRQIDAAATLSTDVMQQMKKFDNITINAYRLPAYVGLFFNLRNPLLSDIHVRRGLAHAINRFEVINQTLAGQASASQFPISAQYPGFNPRATRYLYDPKLAKQELGQNQQYKKNGKLSLTIATINTKEMIAVANAVKSQWQAQKVQVNIVATDVKSLQQNYIRPRNFDILLYGENLGLDSDVYSFWHSSQVDDPGLNVTGYKSSEADKNLESGRIAKDPQNRSNKYAAFVDIWSKDLPAILIYSPHYMYAQAEQLSGYQVKQISNMSDRFYGVEKWAVRQKTIPQKSAKTYSP